LLGLAADSDDPRFKADYLTTFEKIVQRYAAVFVEQGRVMALLYRASLGSQPYRFPSWIPDWTSPNYKSLYAFSRQGGHYCAAANTDPQWSLQSYSDDSNMLDELTIRGCHVDEVSRVSNCANQKDCFWAYFKEATEMVHSLGNYPTGESLLDLKWQVLVAGAKQSEVTNGLSSDLYSSFQALEKMYALALSQVTSGTVLATFEDAKSIIDKAGNSNLSEKFDIQFRKSYEYIHTLFAGNGQFSLSGWRLFATKRGYVGVAPHAVGIGDRVSIFNGGAVPFLARKSELKEGLYRLVGSCYVHGFMSGEEILGVDWKEEEIRLH